MKTIAIAIVLISLVACSQSADDEAALRSTTWDENKEVVRQFMAIMDSQRFDQFDEVLSSDMVAHLPSGDLTRDQADGLVKMFYIGFPDLRHDVEEVVALEDGRVLLRGTLRGTHGGEFLGMPASQLPISFRCNGSSVCISSATLLLHAGRLVCCVDRLNPQGVSGR